MQIINNYQFTVYRKQLPEIILTDDQLLQSQEYAKDYDKRAPDVSHYIQNRKAKAKRIPGQQTIGKMAEFAAAQWIGDWDGPLAPDLTLYDRGAKSFDPDFAIPEADIHVKSRDLIARHHCAASWVFQTNDPLIWKEQDRPQYIYLIYVALPFNSCRLKAFGDFRAIKHLLAPPEREEYAGQKLAIYAHDLERLPR